MIENTRLVFKTGDRQRQESNWILEVAPEIRNALRRTEKLYITARRCKVLDYINLSKCYNCQAYRHIAKL